jgi:hypothetical protein
MLAFSPGWCSDIEQYTTEKDRKQEITLNKEG